MSSSTYELIRREKSEIPSCCKRCSRKHFLRDAIIFFHIRMLPSAGDLVYYSLIFSITLWVTSPGLTAGDNGIGLPSRCPAFLALNASCNGSPGCPICKDTSFKKYLWLLCKANKTWDGYLSWGLLNLIPYLAGNMAACIFLLRSKSLLCPGSVLEEEPLHGDDTARGPSSQPCTVRTSWSKCLLSCIWCLKGHTWIWIHF